MAKTSCTQLTMAQMVDLALSAPDVGVVNFTILHSLLHVLIKKLELNDCQVEFRNIDSERLQNFISTTDIVPKITLTEYSVEPGGKRSKKRMKEIKEIDEKGKADETQTEKTAQSESSLPSLLVIEPFTETVQKPTFSIAITRDYFNQMESDITKLQSQITSLMELPGNVNIIEALRTTEEKRPILDMFQTLNIKKRLDAAEICIEKLTVMLQEIAKEQATQTMNLKSLWDSMRQSITTQTSEDVLITRKNIPKRIADLEEKVFGGNFVELEHTVRTEEIQTIKIDGIEKQLEDMQLNRKSNDVMISERIVFLEGRQNFLETEIGQMQERVNLKFANLPDFQPYTNKLNEKVAVLEENVAELTDISGNLINEKETAKENISLMTDDLAYLKLQLERIYELEMKLTEKVDNSAICGKASLSHISDIYDELGGGIEEALNKLSQQQTLWIEALKEMQLEFERKLDKTDLETTKLWFQNEINRLKTQVVKAMKQPALTKAAATKNKLLKDANCISCDNEVVMDTKFDASLLSGQFPKITTPKHNLPAHVAFEREQLRNQEREYYNIVEFQSVENLNSFVSFSSAWKNINEVSPRSPRKSNREGHKCNRYVGGSHTVITTENRTSRLNKFLEQWRCVIPVDEETRIKGIDGHYYKGYSHKVRPKSSKSQRKDKNEDPKELKTNINKDSSELKEYFMEATSAKSLISMDEFGTSLKNKKAILWTAGRTAEPIQPIVEYKDEKAEELLKKKRSVKEFIEKTLSNIDEKAIILSGGSKHAIET